MFQRGHGRKNYFIIKTAKGYYKAAVAGLESFTNDAKSARRFDDSKSANEFYNKSLKRPIGKNLPKSFSVEKFKSETSSDQNR